MPPETPRTTVLPASIRLLHGGDRAGGLALGVVVADLALQRARERLGGDLGARGLGLAVLPQLVVQAAGLLGGDDGELVLVAPGGRVHDDGRTVEVHSRDLLRSRVGASGSPYSPSGTSRTTRA